MKKRDTKRTHPSHKAMTAHTDPPTVTPAQEAITTAMIAALLTCGAATYAIINLIQITDPIAYVVFTITSFVIAGYLVPNLTACWLGRSLDEIMTPATTQTQHPEFDNNNL